MEPARLPDRRQSGRLHHQGAAKRGTTSRVIMSLITIIRESVIVPTVPRVRGLRASNEPVPKSGTDARGDFL